MEKVAFIGSYDKADLMLYVAKILSFLGKKVILIDATALQKTRYIIPKMTLAKKYITTFENIDIAIGFESIAELKEYKQSEESSEFEYDYALINIDSYKGYYNFKIKTDEKKFFVTTFDLYCLRRGLQVFKRMETPVQVQRVLFSKNMEQTEVEYLDYLSKELNIKWDEEVIFFPFENGDQTALFVNQRSERIQVKGLSSQYISGIRYITEEISDSKQGEIKKAVKMLERI